MNRQDEDYILDCLLWLGKWLFVGIIVMVIIRLLAGAVL